MDTFLFHFFIERRVEESRTLLHFVPSLCVHCASIICRKGNLLDSLIFFLTGRKNHMIEIVGLTQGWLVCCGYPRFPEKIIIAFMVYDIVNEDSLLTIFWGNKAVCFIVAAWRSTKENNLILKF